MNHFVFTNFGVGIKDIVWLTYRFELFSKVLVSSLKNQTDLDFEWYIFISVDMPLIIKEKLNNAISATELRINLVEVTCYSHILPCIRKVVKDVPPDQYVLSTRIDDDDAVSIECFSRIKEQARQLILSGFQYGLISVKDGYEWLPSDLVGRPVSYESLALGLTMLSKSGKEVLTVNEFAHHKIAETMQSKGIPFKHVFVFDCGREFGYLYTKHSLSDSFYSGARARIIKDIFSVSLSDSTLFEKFGILLEDIKSLNRIFSESPRGMPHKYLEVGARLRGLIANDDVDKTSEYQHNLNWHQAVATRKSIPANRKIRLAIIGSCVSRDIFNHIPNFSDRFEVVSYIARQNLASYVALPNSNFTGYFKNLDSNGFEGKRAEWDLNKYHWKVLELSCPDLILVDFIDERIGGIFDNGTVHSASGPVIKMFERMGREIVIERPWGDKLSKIRNSALDVFMKRCYSICNNIIIHKASWASEFLSDKEVLKFSDTKYSRMVELNNVVLDSVFRQLDNCIIPFDTVGGGELMRGGGEHLWSFCPYHYDLSYYKFLVKEIMWRV